MRSHLQTLFREKKMKAETYHKGYEVTRRERDVSEFLRVSSVSFVVIAFSSNLLWPCNGAFGGRRD